MEGLSLAAALEAILAASEIPKGEGTSLEAIAFSWRECRRRIRQLARAALEANIPLHVRRVGELEGYDLWLETEDLPADPRGARLAANLELRVASCPKCARPLDYIGERGAWHCVNVDCEGSIRRRPPAPDPFPPRRSRFSA